MYIYIDIYLPSKTVQELQTKSGTVQLKNMQLQQNTAIYK